ncbi:MAG: TAXI family TRAP transporter solute-binding subunit, partial [Planctomycetales bacterium]|nr:TAXI family TRAP transporter solute-binding subunit [Planctomycetales bacterium]
MGTSLIRNFLVLVLTIVMMAVGGSHALAEKRVALVIGNSDYRHVPKLPNPASDATAIGEALKRIGFDTVIEANDLTFVDFNKSLRDFASIADTADVAVVFFAGHGIAVGNRNYAIPVDAELKSDRDVDYEAVRLDAIVNAVNGARRFRLIILDACRDNPFTVSMAATDRNRSVGRGLGRVEPEGDTLVAFAARDGSTAADGDGNNSPYTAALLANLETPGLEVGLLFRKVRDKVLFFFFKRQQPFVYGSLSSEAFYFVPPGTTPVVAAPDTAPAVPPPAPTNAFVPPNPMTAPAAPSIKPIQPQSEPRFITIGTGGVTGVYYPAGGAICRLVNKDRREHGIRCAVESTGGSIYNINQVRAGAFEFGVSQSDWQFHAYKGTSRFAAEGPFTKERSVFSIYPEPFTIIVRSGSNIARFPDLKGRKVNVG